MCLQCHLGLNSNTIYEQIKNIKEEEFQYFNSTSISHLIISSSGFNNKIVREKAIENLRKYLEWKSDKKVISDLNLQKQLNYIEKNSIKEGNVKALDNFLSNITYVS